MEDIEKQDKREIDVRSRKQSSRKTSKKQDKTKIDVEHQIVGYQMASKFTNTQGFDGVKQYVTIQNRIRQSNIT